MPAPKSVVKLHRGENGTFVEYTSNVDATNYYLFELSRAALRDVGRFVANEFNRRFLQTFPTRKKSVTKYISRKVMSSQNTLYPRVEIAIKNHEAAAALKWQETGTLYEQRHGLLTKTVEENIPQIVEIESKYLSGLSGEAERLKTISEEDVIDEDE